MHATPLTDRGRQPGTIALAGDWHGRAEFAVRAVAAARAGGAEAIVQLGDFGFAYDDPGFRVEAYLAALDEALGPVPLYFIDGNHERFPWLLDRPLDERGLRPLSRRIAHLPRGLRWCWHGREWLALGGAHSVNRLLLDRGPREAPSTSWWPEESLNGEQIALACDPGPSEVLLSHDAPLASPASPGYPPGSYPRGDELADRAHRRLVQAVMDAVRPRLVLHGHFHRRYRSTVRTGGRACEVIGLAHDGGSVADNLAWLDARTLRIVPPTGPLPAPPRTPRDRETRQTERRAREGREREEPER